VKETGDHGSLNSWGRDRYWRPSISEVNAWVRQVPELPRLDAVEPVILRNNRWRCDHGWDIDLDDGSSFFVITNNLCLRGGIKCREGFGRVVENNIMVGSGFHPHVWYANSGDIFRRNIVWTDYRPALMPPPPWGLDLDRNLLHREGVATAPADVLQRSSGRDACSLSGDAQFIAPGRGDYRVKPGSPALALGFINFPMDQFGVTSPALRKLARTPVLPGQAVATTDKKMVRETSARTWLGAKVRSIADEGEMSAFGLPGVAGVLLLEVPPRSTLARAGLRANDVILSVNGSRISDTRALVREVPAIAGFQSVTLRYSRQQKESEVTVGE
jgi:hypothetical protein